MTPENDSKKNSECDLTIIRKPRYKNHVPFPTTTNRKRLTFASARWNASTERLTVARLTRT